MSGWMKDRACGLLLFLKSRLFLEQLKVHSKTRGKIQRCAVFPDPTINVPTRVVHLLQPTNPP